MKKPKSKVPRLAVGAIIPILVLALWFILFKSKGEQTNYAIGPHQALHALANDWENVWPNALLSLRRLVVGVVLGVVFGAVSGIGLARFRWARLMFGPTRLFFSAIPFLVWIPFLLMAFGFTESFRLSVVVVSTFLLAHGQCFQGIAQLDPDFTELSRIYEKTPSQILGSVLIPATMPAIFVAARASFVLGWIAVALAESAAAEIPNGGLGFYILRAKGFGQPDIMFGGVLVLAVLAFGIDCLIARLQKWVTRWCDSEENIAEAESSS